MTQKYATARIEGSLRALRIGLMALVALFAAAADAQLDIEIRRGVTRPVPIAVVPFGWQGSGPAPFDVAGLVATDLRNSGRFDPLPRSDMLARPTEPVQVNFQDWRVSEVDELVIGRLVQSGPDDYTVHFQLLDVLRGQQLLGYRLTTSGDDLRATAHRIADMIFEELTGIQGVFGTQIAYVSEQRDADGVARYQLIVADADGANAQVIADSPQPLMSPAWSPDGRRLAYVSFEGNQSAIYVQTLRTGTRQRVSAREGINGAPAFSPDGRRLALTLSRDGNLDVYTLDIANQVLRQLTNSPAIDTEPAWAPDGDSIYFTSDRAGGPQVYNVSAEGGRAQRITFEGNYNSRPRVSPDGEQVAIVHQNQGNFRIAVVDLSNGLTQVLSNGQQDESPSYAPNGAVLIYATRENGKGVLASVSSDGRIQQRIASGEGDVREPAWSPFPRP